MVASIYLRHGIGPGPENLGIVEDVARALRAQDGEWNSVVGGDFNMEPGTLADSGADREMGSSIIFPDTARGTFRTATVSSLLDFFMVSDRFSAAIETVGTLEGTGVRGHVPVRLVFRPRVTSLKALHLRQPPPRPLERVYGPLPPPPDWGEARVAADAALAAARAGSDDFERLLETAYQRWVNIAEHELEGCTGAVLKKKGVRGQRPNVVWRSVVPEKSPPVRYPRQAAAQFMRSIAMEIQRIGSLVYDSVTRPTGAGEHGSAARGPHDRLCEDMDGEADVDHEGGQRIH